MTRRDWIVLAVALACIVYVSCTDAPPPQTEVGRAMLTEAARW